MSPNRRSGYLSSAAPTPYTIDSDTEAGTRQLVALINAYWAERGREAGAQAVQQIIRGHRGPPFARWVIRSNLGLGLPPEREAGR